MSVLEKEELFTLIHAMTEEEQAVVCRALPAEIMWSELYRRYEVQADMLAKTRDILRIKV